MANDKQQAYFDAQVDALFNLIVSSTHSWRKAWSTDEFLQQNHNGVAYKNYNQMTLFFDSLSKGSQDPRWFTFNQIKDAGYHLKKGSKSSVIGFYTRSYDKLQKDEQGNVVLDDNGKKQYDNVQLSRPILKMYNVFNAKDIEGLEPYIPNNLSLEDRAKMNELRYQNADKMARDFCHANGINLVTDAITDSNSFIPSMKLIQVAKKEQFSSLAEYYNTFFHELAHSTMVLDIRETKRDDNKQTNYAREELTAELTALFMSKETGVDTHCETSLNSLAYLRSWLNTGMLDREDLSVAIKEASRASNALLKHLPKMDMELALNVDVTQRLDEIKSDIQKKSSVSETTKPTDATKEVTVTDTLSVSVEKGNDLFETLISRPSDAEIFIENPIEKPTAPKIKEMLSNYRDNAIAYDVSPVNKITVSHKSGVIEFQDGSRVSIAAGADNPILLTERVSVVNRLVANAERQKAVQEVLVIEPKPENGNKMRM